MLIQVHYPDNRFDYVNDRLLNILIEYNEVVRFKRSSGWVTIGSAPLRRFQRNYTYITDLTQNPAGKFKNLIRVEYRDYCYGYVTAEVLDDLIESNSIIKFKRKSGWVTIGFEPIRKAQHELSYF